MKVLLVHAYHLMSDPGETRVMKPYPPLGILYLSAYLKREGHQVQVFDGTFRDPDELPALARSFKPDAIGFYANMMTRMRVIMLRQTLEGLAPLFLVGGPDPPHYAQHYLDNGFDVVISGEGEGTVNALLQADHGDWSHIAGLIYRHEGVDVRTDPRSPDLVLDQLPLPDREAIDLNAYLDCWETHHQMRPISLITSRGCPFQCTWCSHNVYGHSLRKRDPAAVIEEMQWLSEHYNFSHYWFADDVFNIKPKWLMSLHDQLMAQPQLKRPFECIARADRFTPGLVAAMAEMGCFRCWVGAESGSQRLLDQMKRGVKRHKVAEVVEELRSHGIQTGMFFMWGFGDESFEDVLETVSLAELCLPDIALTTVAYPIKGTAYHTALGEQGRLGDEPLFTAGTDRDVAILGQAPKDAYILADRLLHSRMQAKRLKMGSAKGKLKSFAHSVRAHLLEAQLKKRFSGYPLPVPSPSSKDSVSSD